MRVTTLRFGSDLWQLLEHEAALDGVSVSQYVREAALARAVGAAVVRGEGPLELLSGATREVAAADPDPERRHHTEHVLAPIARFAAAKASQDAVAVRAQALQAQHSATERRAHSEKLRAAVLKAREAPDG
jgi:hypothetical protein